MTPADQLAHFSGSTDDLAMSGLWYSHKRVTELVQAAKAEAGQHLAERAEEFDPSDDYHEGTDYDARSYYAAVDRCVRLMRGEISDWKEEQP